MEGPKHAANGPSPQIDGFEIREPLGMGGMGAVYRALELEIDREVALKVIHQHLAADESFRARFRSEMRFAVTLQHPNIVPIYRTGEAPQPFISMLLVPGDDLATQLKANGAMEAEKAVMLVRQVASALSEAHSRNVIHRDVKPQNVIVDERAGHAYLTDFGLARSLDATKGLTATGIRMGTIDYMSPEQIEGEGVDQRSDIYALGCLLYALLTGRRPFAGESDASVIREKMRGPSTPPLTALGLSPALEAVVQKAQAERPDERYGSADEFAAAAADAMRGGPQSHVPSEQTQPMRTQAYSTTYAEAREAPTRIVQGEATDSPHWFRRIAIIGALALLIAGLAAVVVSRGGSDHNPVGATTSTKVADATTTADSRPQQTETVTETVPETSVPPAKPKFTTFAATLYQAEVPKGWTAELVDEKNSGRYTSQWRDPGDANTSVLIDAQYPAPDLSPAESASGVRNQTSLTSGYNEVSFRPISLNGQPAVEWIFDVPGDRRVDYFFNSCGEGFAVLGSTAPDKFVGLKPTFRHVAESVTPFCE